MRPRKSITALCGVLAGCAAWLALGPAAPADDKPAVDGIVIIDARGKEQKIKGFEFVVGTRRLTWLAPDAPEKKDPDEGTDSARGRKPARPQGPEALVFRDDNSTNWKDGVLTLIPLDRIREIEYDNEKETATVKVAAGAKPEADVTTTGTTKFAQVNKLTIEAEVDKGDLGVAAVKYLGGVKNGIKGVRFPSPKAGPGLAGRTAQVGVNDRTKKITEKVTDLQVLYRTATGEKVSPLLLFKKTIRLDLAKVKKLTAGDGEGGEWQVALKDGNEETLTLLQTGEIDGKAASFQGFVGKVPAGWKLFPAHTVTEIVFEDPPKP